MSKNLPFQGGNIKGQRRISKAYECIIDDIQFESKSYHSLGKLLQYYHYVFNICQCQTLIVNVDVSFKFEWEMERILWIGYYQNNDNGLCMIKLLPKEIVNYLVGFLRRQRRFASTHA